MKGVLAVRTYASGSSANLALVRTRHTAVLLDLGLGSERGIRAALADSGLGPDHVAAALVSHSHTDHLNPAGVRFCAREGVPILGTGPTLAAAAGLHARNGGAALPDGLLQEIRPGATYLVEDLEVTPFAVSHDVPTVGFVMCCGTGTARRKVVIATDLGCAPDALVPHFADADAIFLEANYNQRMLDLGTRPVADRRRVGSNMGHLSNAQAGTFLNRVLGAGRLPAAVVLVHLSQSHNRPDLALDEVARFAGLAGLPVPVRTAPRTGPGDAIEL
jgi:phosphoribosyl 1,2-cyclic phosphodiesterase